MDRFGDNYLRFENLVNYDKSKTSLVPAAIVIVFENLVNYDKSKTFDVKTLTTSVFENLVNYDKSKTVVSLLNHLLCLRTL